MIEAEILKEKFRVVTDTMRKLKRQRLVILIYLAMSALLLVLINHPEWLPKGHAGAHAVQGLIGIAAA